METYNPQFLKWWETRGITEDVLQKYGIRIESVDIGNQQNANYAVIPYRKEEVEFNKKFVYHTGKTHFHLPVVPYMYGMDTVVANLPLIVVQSELDYFVLEKAGFTNVVSLPHEFNNWKVHLEAITKPLDMSPTVILAFNKDEDSLTHQEIISNHIGVHKCQTVEYPENCRTLTDVFKDGGYESIKAVIATAKHIPISNVHTFVDYAKVIHTYYTKGVAKGLSTGFPNLDRYYTLQAGTVTVVTGIPMAGKSEILDAVVLNTIADHGWKWVYYSPENLPVEFHFQKLAEKFMGKAFFGDNRMSEEEVIHALKKLSEMIYIITPQEDSLTLEQILLKVKVCLHRYKVKGFILDPYNEVEHTRPAHMGESEYVSLFLSKLRNFTRINMLKTFLVAHPKKLEKDENNKGEYPVPTPYDISGSAHFRNKADGNWSIWRKYNNNPNNEVELHIQKVRNKNIGRTGKVVFEWQRETGIFVPKNCDA